MNSTKYDKLILVVDELYTKVKKNKEPHLSEGWTVVVKEKESRFNFFIISGKRDDKLFEKVAKKIIKIAENSKKVILLTDSEKRYLKYIFKYYHTYIKGKRGRPKRVLRPNIIVIVINKAKQKRGEKDYYQIYKHPDIEMEDIEISMNSSEATNASIRRHLACYRRRSNTMKKKKSNLNKLLKIEWIIRNFIYKHPSTSEVPAVKLGIIKRGLTFRELFSMRIK